MDGEGHNANANTDVDSNADDAVSKCMPYCLTIYIEYNYNFRISVDDIASNIVLTASLWIGCTANIMPAMIAKLS